MKKIRVTIWNEYVHERTKERIRQVYDQRASLELDADQQRLLDLTYARFVRSGALLGEAEKARLKEINAALAANEYIGVGKGFEGDVKVKVTMDGNKIAKIDVLEQKESMPQTSMVDIPARVIAAQSVEGIDVVAGSTVSSNALIEAIKDALSQVK